MDTVLNEINEIIEKELWYDFEIRSFDGSTLIIFGGIDLFYAWIIEIQFIDVGFILCKSDWKKAGNLKGFEKVLGDEEKQLKRKYFIEDIYNVFAINHDDFDSKSSNRFIIAAMGVNYLTNVSSR
jgi:hypothetical protein